MKKFVMGLLIGVGVAFAFSAQAEEIKSFIGAKIEGQFPVAVNGETIENPGIVVGGISYLPTRSIAELAGFDVYFDADLGIKLTRQENEKALKVEKVEEVVPIETINTEAIERRLREIDHSIFIIRDRQIYTLDIVINDPLSSEQGRQEAIQKKTEFESMLSQLEAEKAALEAQLNAG